MLHRLLHVCRRAPSLWRRYWGLPAARRRALWQAAGWILVVRAALELFPFRRILKLIESRARHHLGYELTHRAGAQDRDAQRQALRSDGSPSVKGVRHPREQSSLTPSPPQNDRPAQGHVSPQLLAEQAVRRDPAVDRTLWAVWATGRRLMPERPCLTQALVGRLLLARHGIDTVIQIGVTKDDAELKAHAWLEHDGTIVLGGAQSRDEYRPFPALQV